MSSIHALYSSKLLLMKSCQSSRSRVYVRKGNSVLLSSGSSWSWQVLFTQDTVIFLCKQFYHRWFSCISRTSNKKRVVKFHVLLLNLRLVRHLDEVLLLVVQAAYRLQIFSFCSKRSWAYASSIGCIQRALLRNLQSYSSPFMWL